MDNITIEKPISTPPIEDIRSLINAVLVGQAKGGYTLENCEQIYPILKRLLEKYPSVVNVPPKPLEMNNIIKTEFSS